MYRALVFPLALLTVALAACSDDGAGATVADGSLSGLDQPGPDQPDPDQAGVDALRGLPYTGFSRKSQGDREGVVLRDADDSQPGLSLYTTFARSRADLIDEAGLVVNSWGFKPSASWGNAELMQNGDLVVTGIQNVAKGNGRYLMRLDWDGNVLWRKALNAHHDAEEQPDGGLLTLTYEKQDLPRFSSNVPTRVDFLQWFDADGTAGARISLLDVLEREAEGYKFRRVGEKRGLRSEGKWVDLFHANTARTLRRPELAERHALYRPGNVLATIRHQDVVAVVDPRDASLVWSWGHGQLSGPHHAQLLESGNLLIFDNGLHPKRQWSRVLELDPVSKTIVWEYKAPVKRDFFTLGRGSCQRLANGNTLIAESDNGRAFEVTPEGRIVWEFINPRRDPKGRPASIVRMRRFPRVWFGDRFETR